MSTNFNRRSFIQSSVLASAAAAVSAHGADAAAPLARVHADQNAVGLHQHGGDPRNVDVGLRLVLFGLRWGFSGGLGERRRLHSAVFPCDDTMAVDENSLSAGSPDAKKIVLELADGLLAHRKVDASGRGTLPSAVHFATDREGESIRAYFPWHLFWSAWKWTGDRKYIAPILDNGPTGLMSINANALDLLDLRAAWGPRLLGGEAGRPVEGRPKDGRTAARSNAYRNSASSHFGWQLTGDKKLLEALYATQIEECDLTEYINTEGSLWIDRVGVPYTDLQRARLGGIALVRNGLFPGHAVSWKFAAPANDQSVAILIPNATTTGMKIIVYNLESQPVRATMTAWNVDPGQWEITQGIDTTGSDIADGAITSRSVKLERSADLAIEFAPRATTIMTLKLKTPGTPYWSRPDLGIERGDVTLRDGALLVKVHSLGSVRSSEAAIVFKDRGKRKLLEKIIYDALGLRKDGKLDEYEKKIIE